MAQTAIITARLVLQDAGFFAQELRPDLDRTALRLTGPATGPRSGLRSNPGVDRHGPATATHGRPGVCRGQQRQRPEAVAGGSALVPDPIGAAPGARR